MTIQIVPAQDLTFKFMWVLYPVLNVVKCERVNTRVNRAVELMGEESVDLFKTVIYARTYL